MGSELHLQLVQLGKSSGGHSEEMDGLFQQLSALFHDVQVLAGLVQQIIGFVTDLLQRSARAVVLLPVTLQLFRPVSQLERLLLKVLLMQQPIVMIRNKIP